MKPKFIDEIRNRHPELSYEISDDGIAVFDGLFSSELCQSLIEHFERVDKAGGTYNRRQGFDRASHITEDDAVDFNNHTFPLCDEIKTESKEFLTVFWGAAYKLYFEKYSVLADVATHQIFNLKLQRTKPGGGYHVWHMERASSANRDRIMTFILYLNDVYEGGETEFLYFKRRITPKIGRFVLWPTDYPHTHRGNPPLKGYKYILTGWVEF